METVSGAHLKFSVLGSYEPFSRYARELAWLDTAPDPRTPLISQAAAQPARSTQTVRWTRSYGSFNPQCQLFCVFFCAATANRRQVCPAELFASHREALNEGECVIIETPAGWIKLSPLGDDPIDANQHHASAAIDQIRLRWHLHYQHLDEAYGHYPQLKPGLEAHLTTTLKRLAETDARAAAG